MIQPAPRDDDDRRRLLRTYLTDHRAGAEGGRRLARRLRGHLVDAAAQAEVDALAQEIDDDCRLLDAVMVELGISPSRPKTVLGAAAELVGRLKPNGRLVGTSPLSPVLELEGLAGGVVVKQRLWSALIAAGRPLASADEAELRRRAERAEDQVRRIAALHRRAAATAFSS